MPKKIKANQFDDTIDRFWACIALVITFVILCVSSLRAAINPDEREHLSMVFNIAHGMIPYADFFEHHHSLLWYIAQPLVWIFGEQANIYLGARVFNILVLLAIAFYLYKIGCCCHLSSWQALWIPSFYFSFDAVLLTGIEFRPDNLMMLFFMAGFFYFLNYMQSIKRADLFKAGFLFFLSFCALQKAVLYLLVISGEFGYFFYRQKNNRKIIIKDLLYVNSWLGAIVGIIILFFIYHGMWRDYFELNWLFNGKLVDDLVFGHKILWVYWVGYILVLGLLVYRFVPLEIKFLSGLYLLLPILICIYLQYVLPFSAFLSIIIVWCINTFFKGWHRLLVFLVSLLCCVYNSAPRYSRYFYQHDRLLVSLYWDDIVLKHSQTRDLILSECRYPQFFGGIRQPPLDYYQFSLFDMAYLDYDVFARHSFPDLNLIVQTQKPKIVVNRDWLNCRLSASCPVMQVLDRTYMQKYYINYQDRFYIRKE